MHPEPHAGLLLSWMPVSSGHVRPSVGAAADHRRGTRTRASHNCSKDLISRCPYAGTQDHGFKSEQTQPLQSYFVSKLQNGIHSRLCNMHTQLSDSGHVDARYGV